MERPSVAPGRGRCTEWAISGTWMKKHLGRVLSNATRVEWPLKEKSGT